VADRKTFDEIGASCQDAGENENGHVLVKQVGNHVKDEVTVIFQPWIKSRHSMRCSPIGRRKGGSHEHGY
jgi:hypothetical protein